jgi:hypothetical protein
MRKPFRIGSGAGFSGGGTPKHVHEQIGIVSTLIDRDRVPTQVTMKGWSGNAKAA